MTLGRKIKERRLEKGQTQTEYGEEFEQVNRWFASWKKE